MWVFITCVKNKTILTFHCCLRIFVKNRVCFNIFLVYILWKFEEVAFECLNCVAHHWSMTQNINRCLKFKRSMSSPRNSNLNSRYAEIKWFKLDVKEYLEAKAYFLGYNTQF